VGCAVTKQPSVDSTPVAKDSRIILPQYFEEAYPKTSLSDTLKYIFSHLDPRKSNYIELLGLYSKNDSNAIWTCDTLVNEGLKFLALAKNHGLNPVEYGYQLIDSLYRLINSGGKTSLENYVRLELMLSNGLISYSKHLVHGKLNPNKYHPSWNYNRRDTSILDSVIIQRIMENNIANLELQLEPRNANYTALKKELRKYYALKSERTEWKPLKYPGFIMKMGDSSLHVLQLKQRLKNQIAFNNSTSPVFDSDLEQALKTFQQMHGLTTDAIPGKNTYEFLSWSVDRYIEAMIVNLERARWLDNEAIDAAMLVNIPGFQLWFSDDNTLIFSTRLVVGKPKNETPVFQSHLTYMVFNPCWTVPNSIATEKIIPKLLKDSLYLEKHNMFLGLNDVEQNIDSIDMSQFTTEYFPYKIYQRAGLGNALGSVKFMFDNSYSIYLHDTPSKQLFQKDRRALSQGCVRVQNAVELAEIILANQVIQKFATTDYLKKGYPVKAHLQTPIALSIFYFTCFNNLENNQLQFFSDVYAKDLRVLLDMEK
jgi:murein L,D-transpeptidase YcbB/YkuD